VSVDAFHKKEAEHIVNVVIESFEATLLDNLGSVSDAFTLTLGSFGKFSVRQEAGILRKIPCTGETILRRIDGRSGLSVWAAYGNVGELSTEIRRSLKAHPVPRGVRRG